MIGDNFVYSGVKKAACIFGGNISTVAVIINETLLYCDTPSVLNSQGENVNNITNYTIDITINGIDVVPSNKTFIYYTQPTLISITPAVGPITGNTKINLTGSDFSTHCNVTVKFGTIEVNGDYQAPKNDQPSYINTSSPAVTCPGDTVVQVSLNGQQYTPNLYPDDKTVFTYYGDIFIAYNNPVTFPVTGGSVINIYGGGFLFSKNSTDLSDGTKKFNYTCRFKDSHTGQIFGSTPAISVQDDRIQCKTIPLDTINDEIVVEISPNGQDWYGIEENLNFVTAPRVHSINPQFGQIKQSGTKLNVTGINFDCEDPKCPHLKCSFSTDEYNILTHGERIDSNHIICDIPSVSRPDVTILRITVDGVDFTPDNVTYTFYEAFILAADPEIIPVEGGTNVTLIGYGFADSGEIIIELEQNEILLKCANTTDGNCYLPGRYKNSQRLEFTAPPQKDVNKNSGQNIFFEPFNVEASVYGNSFTDNNISLMYYEQPILGNLTPDGSPYPFHRGSSDSVYVPITIKVPPGMDPEVFLRKTKLRCRYEIGDEVIITEATLVKYPLPVESSPSDQKVLTCPIPDSKNTGVGNLSISINGQDFVGSEPIRVLEKLKIKNINPTCGPTKGGSHVKVSSKGVDDTDIGNLFFTWSTVCTSPILKDWFIDNSTIATIAPPAPVPVGSPGGASLVMFSVDKKLQLANNTVENRVRNHFESTYEYLYYPQPYIQTMYPHSGNYKGGTPITVEGAFLFEDKEHSCTPKCRFGDKVVEGEFISTVRVKCIAPPGEAGSNVAMSVSMNGFEDADTLVNHRFYYLNDSKINDISPKAGPSSGGTLITVSGENFADLSIYTSEFKCVFTSQNLEIPQKRTPAKYVNSTTILCTSPGGWGAGNIANVDITFNGIELTGSTHLFRFYQIDRINPLSGPSNGDGNVVTFYGSGFVGNDEVACEIAGIHKKAISVNWTHIQCPIPRSPYGDDFFGKVDFYYTLNGKDRITVIQGFTYYQQPEVSEVIPPFIPVNGGSFILRGNYFRSDFFGAVLSCKIGETVAPASLINGTHITCEFNTNIDIGHSVINHAQVALNNYSYTPKSSDTFISVFDGTVIKPHSGIIEGGTPVRVIGYGFPTKYAPLCRFGVPGKYTTTYGTTISENELVCNSPPADLPKGVGYPFEGLFALSFDKESWDTWNLNGRTFDYYKQPKFISLTPDLVRVDLTTLVNVTASTDLRDTIVGAYITLDDALLDTEIACRFGRFGTSKGYLTTNKIITCPTPNSQVPSYEVGEEAVKLEVAINGQDFTTSENLNIKFYGTKSGFSRGVAWVIGIILGVIVLAGLIYLVSKVFQNYSYNRPLAETKPESVLDPNFYPRGGSVNPIQPRLSNINVQHGQFL